MLPSLSLVPRCLRPAGQSPVHSLLGAWKYSSATRTVVGPDKEPMECPIADMTHKTGGTIIVKGVGLPC